MTSLFKRIGITFGVIGVSTLTVWLLNMILPLWLSIIIGVFVIPVTVVVVFTIAMCVSYPLLLMWGLLLWGLYSEGNSK